MLETRAYVSLLACLYRASSSERGGAGLEITGRAWDPIRRVTLSALAGGLGRTRQHAYLAPGTSPSLVSLKLRGLRRAQRVLRSRGFSVCVLRD